MKKFIIFIFLFFLVNQIGQAQGKYSIQNLQKASKEELKLYKDEALKLQKKGRIYSIVGLSSFGVAIFCAITGMDFGYFGPNVRNQALLDIGGGAMIVGVISLAIGIPMSIKGRSRVERIMYDVNVDLRPSIQHNLATQNCQPGVTLRIRF